MKADNTPTITAHRRKPSDHLRLHRETTKKLHKMAKKDITAKVLAKTPANRTAVNKLWKPPRPGSKFRGRQKREDVASDAYLACKEGEGDYEVENCQY